MTFSPDEILPVLILPEGKHRGSLFRSVFGLADSHYDPLWKYISKVKRDTYPKEAPLGVPTERGSRLAFRGIPTFADFDNERLFVGKKVAVPFADITGLVVADGLPGEPFDGKLILLARIIGCSAYLPIHEIQKGANAVALLTALKREMQARIGILFTAIAISVEPGMDFLQHRDGTIRLDKIKGILTSKDPMGNVVVSLRHRDGKLNLSATPDDENNLERLGNLADEILALTIHGSTANWKIRKRRM